VNPAKGESGYASGGSRFRVTEARIEVQPQSPPSTTGGAPFLARPHMSLASTRRPRRV